MAIYSLVSENLTSLGFQGAKTTINWTRYFDNMKKAKAAAEKDYGEKIKWEKRGKNSTSGDLRYVMYYIRPIKVE